jgi:uncharacterized protein (DUF111 family)
MSKHRHKRRAWKKLSVHLSAAVLAVAAGWGTVEVEHPPAPTPPVCTVQLNGPVKTPFELAHLDEAAKNASMRLLTGAYSNRPTVTMGGTTRL